MNTHTTHRAAGSGPHHMMLGSVTVSRILGGEETGGDFALMELRGLPGSGPGAHLDPWRESFYVLEGEITFRVEEDGGVREIRAGAGDSVSIPAGVGHAFSVSSDVPARYLMIGSHAGVDAFFADAGEPIASAELPDEPLPFDRDRLLAAFAKHELATDYSFPEPAEAAR